MGDFRGTRMSAHAKDSAHQEMAPAATASAGEAVRAWFDEQGFADALEAVLDNAAARERLRAAGLIRAAEFTWERTARATLDVYRRAC